MNQHQSRHTHINWLTSVFLTLNPVIAIIGTIMLAYHHAIAWPTVLLGLVYGIATGMSITCGYHRLFSHGAYQVKQPIRILFALFGAAAFEGSVFEWSTDHRNHHRYTDTDQDPYNAKRGFWYSHIGWLFLLDPDKRDFSNIKDLQEDSFLRFQHRYYLLVSGVMGYIVPMAIAMLWGDLLGGFIIACALRITMNQHITFFVNSICHIFGKQTYSDHVTAVDNWVTALFTYGEGFHNFHHKFPLDYRNGIRLFHFDPTKWVINLLSYLGLATNLKQVSTKRIVECRMQMDEKRLKHQVKQSTWQLGNVSPMLVKAKESVMQSVGSLEELEKAYANLKARKDEFIKDQKSLYRRKKQEMKQTMKQMKKDLRASLNQWSHTIEQSVLSLKAQHTSA